MFLGVFLITCILIHHSLKLLNLSGTITLSHTISISLMRMRLIIFLLKNHRPVVELGCGVLQNFRDWAVDFPGNSHCQSKSKTAPD